MYEEFSAVYDAKIREDFDYRAMADFIRGMIRRHGGTVHRALDMGCGTANATLELKGLAAAFILVDPSADMLTLAQDKFTGPDRPQFLQAAAPDFVMADCFDLIYSVLDIPNYLDSPGLEGFLRNSWTNLTDGGLLIFDVSAPHRLEAMAKTGVFIDDEDDYFHVWENHLTDGRLELTLNAFIRDPSRTTWQRITEEQVMYLHPIQQIEEMARTTGYTLIGTYDGYQDQPAGPNSDRVVFALKKENQNNG